MPVSPALQFLPSWPIELGHIGWFAMLLLLAAVLGEVASRVFRVTKIAGYVLAGLVLGANGLGVFDAAGVAQMGIFVDIALGLLLFELGHRLDLGWLRRNPWLLASSLLEAGAAFGAVFATLTWLGVSNTHAFAAAAIGMATSPAVVVRVTAELRAQGQVTERMLTLTALNNIYAVVTMTAFLAWQHERSGDADAVLYPIYLVSGSFLLAVVGAVVVRYLLNVAGRSEEVSFLMLAGALILLITFALAANVSVLLCLLAFGTLTKHVDPRLRAIPRPFGAAGAVFIVLLFAIGGVKLDLSTLPTAGLLALAYIGARQAGKWVGVLATALPSGISLRKAGLLGVSLCPMSSLVMATATVKVAAISPEPGSDVAAIILAAVAILEFAGPIAAHFSLIGAREANPSPRS